MLFKGTWKIHVCAPLPLSSPPLPPLVLLDYVCRDMTNTGRRKTTVIYQCSWRWHHAVNTTTSTVAMFSKLTCVRLRAACFSKYSTSVIQVHGDVHVPLRWQRGCPAILVEVIRASGGKYIIARSFNRKEQKLKHKYTICFFKYYILWQWNVWRYTGVTVSNPSAAFAKCLKRKSSNWSTPPEQNWLPLGSASVCSILACKIAATAVSLLLFDA